MDNDMKGSLDRLMTEWKLSEDEKKFIGYSKTAVTADINHSSVLAQFFLTKQIEISTKEIIESNRLLGEAENNNSNKMQMLTWALVAVGALQAIAVIIN